MILSTDRLIAKLVNALHPGTQGVLDLYRVRLRQSLDEILRAFHNPWELVN